MELPGFIFKCSLNHHRSFILTFILLDASAMVYYVVVQKKEAIPTLLSISHTVCGLLCTLISLVWLTCHKDTLPRITANLDKVKAQLNADLIPSHHLKEWYVGLALILIKMLVYVFRIRSMLLFCLFITFYSSTLFSYLLNGQFNCLLCSVKSLYTDLLNCKEPEESVVCSHLLSKIVDDICQLYKYPILQNISWCFLLCFVQSYHLLRPDNHRTFWGKIPIILGIPADLYQVTLIIRSCNGLTKQVKKFNEHLYRQITKDKSCQLLNSERLDFHFIVANEVNFTACDFFSIDNSLICSMISTATTYLVILLQCSSGTPSHQQAKMNTTMTSD